MKVERGPALAYGVLGLPLAFAALPIYVHAPKLYADGLGLPLAAIGAVLLGVRIVDAVTDPIIGWASDRFVARRAWIVAALPLLAAGFIALLGPPAGAGLLWLAASLLLVTLGYSLATINYAAWGAELADTPDGRTRVVASREGFALAGVVLAAGLPSVLGNDPASGLAWLGWTFPFILLLGAGLTLRFAPAVVKVEGGAVSLRSAMRDALACRPFARLLVVFAANGIAAAIPAATVLFFVSDVLQAESASGLFLILYFLAGAASMPLWVRCASVFGKHRAWLIAMLLAMAVFAWAATLGAGDLRSFALICVLSGAALGADLALPAAMLADLLARERSAGPRAGAWFGWWNLVSKANLAIAAGLALPLLDRLGYAPGTRDPDALAVLAGVYALLPVALKALAVFLLWRYRSDLMEEERRCAEC
ncbi:MFS transporter [Azoarcus sp. CIB]|uniref:MFS transporter n=1 Tax=Aromatoleum sp. (strain CIB) TaxID=198107 RepID=UPI00067C518A|nr:MFS transporter [Azoarcus sp. CIB]